MTPATLLAEIEQADGEVWMDGDRLKFRGIPARLIPLIREHKAALLALLSAPAHDDYAAAERLAIQEESEQPPFDDPGGTAGVPGFEDMPDLTPAEHGVILRQLMERAETHPSTTTAASVQHSASMALPERVTCSSCAEFIPGREPNSLGKCARTAGGLPPVASRGYGACFPFAPRTCPDFKEILK